MKRPDIPRTLGLAFAAAAVALGGAAAGDAPSPGPGLEIVDGGTPYLPPGGTSGDIFADPFAEPAIVQPPYQPPTLGRPQIVQPEPEAADPFADAFNPQGGPSYYGDPSGGFAVPADADPFADLDAPQISPVPGYAAPDPGYPASTPGYGAPMPDYGQGAPGYGVPPADAGPFAGQPPEGVPDYVPFSLVPVTDNFNTRNPIFPGLGEAAASGDLPGAAGIIWDVLKRRRIVDATMSRGVRGSVGRASPGDMGRVMEAVGQTATPGEDPLLTAYRINTLLDAFEQPVVEDYSFGAAMPEILIRLNDDIQILRLTMPECRDDGVYLEIARTYIRAATTCDFFAFGRRQMVLDVRAIMERGSGMFFPDGASVGGDTAGITGNLFQIALMMDRYSRDDSAFRRDIGSTWRTLEKPARYILDVAGVGLALPNYGPRASRELLPQDLGHLEALFPPRQQPRIQRIGLAGTNSFPASSTADVYGGVYVTRDNAGGVGRSMAVRFGPWGTLWHVPTHNDFGTLHLVSRGTRYLVDPGGYGGESATAAAHGGLSLNGNFVEENTYTRPGQKASTVWRTNASIDYATDMAGYADGKTWQRTVLYVKNLPGETRSDYWMVLDNVDMNNDPTPQQATLRFQLAPGIQAYNDGAGIFASGGTDGSGMRFFAVDAGANIQVADAAWSDLPSHVYDTAGGALASPSVSISRTMVGDSTAATIIYPSDDYTHRPRRIDRDADIIRGRTGAIVIDHGMDRMDVIAWAHPGTELVTPTLNLQLSADLAVFRVRRGKIARIDFVNLERFQAREPDGGLWSLRVNGPAQTISLEPEAGGGWNVLSDPANRGAADFLDVNFGPTVTRSKFSIRPGEMRVVTR